MDDCSLMTDMYICKCLLYKWPSGAEEEREDSCTVYLHPKLSTGSVLCRLFTCRVGIACRIHVRICHVKALIFALHTLYV